MTALDALKLAHGNEDIIARPVTWVGTGRGIRWEESNSQSPMVWRFGWRVAGVPVPFSEDPIKAKEFGTAKMPEPEELFGEWEIIDHLQLRSGMPQFVNCKTYHNETDKYEVR